MNSKKFYCIISILLVLVWMALVFKLSAENSIKSDNTSGRVVNIILKILYNENEITQEIVGNVTFWVRKFAHFILYVMGGFLITNCIFNCFNKLKGNFYISIAIGTLYSVIDELHQTFVPGRSGEIRDVLIDTVGVIIGAFIFYVIYKTL